MCCDCISLLLCLVLSPFCKCVSDGCCHTCEAGWVVVFEATLGNVCRRRASRPLEVQTFLQDQLFNASVVHTHHLETHTVEKKQNKTHTHPELLCLFSTLPLFCTSQLCMFTFSCLQSLFAADPNKSSTAATNQGQAFIIEWLQKKPWRKAGME